MEGSKAGLLKELTLGLDATMEEGHNLMSNSTTEEEYTSMSNLLEEFSSISNIDNVWTFKSDSGMHDCSSYLYHIYVNSVTGFLSKPITIVIVHKIFCFRVRFPGNVFNKSTESFGKQKEEICSIHPYFKRK